MHTQVAYVKKSCVSFFEVCDSLEEETMKSTSTKHNSCKYVVWPWVTYIVQQNLVWYSWISYRTLQFFEPYSVITFMPYHAYAFKVKYVFQGHYIMFDIKAKVTGLVGADVQHW